MQKENMFFFAFQSASNFSKAKVTKSFYEMLRLLQFYYYICTRF